MGRHPLLAAYLALTAVCFFWGTTYLGIRIALESFPPLTLVSARFLVSGTVLLAAAALRGARIPRGNELWRNAVLGVTILGVGNGCLTYSELWVSSGMAALLLTTAPFWLVGLEALVPGGERLHLPTVLGLLVGLAGTALLVAPRPGPHGLVLDANLWKGFLLLQFGCFSWNFGSIMQRRSPGQTHAIVSGAVQQFAVGVAFLPAALLAPQPAVHWSAKGVLALLWLIVFGSIVGYSAYIYTLEKLPLSLVSMYNYVNPVVAVVLGWLFYAEPFGRKEVLAMLIIFAGVAVVKRYGRRGAPPA